MLYRICWWLFVLTLILTPLFVWRTDSITDYPLAVAGLMLVDRYLVESCTRRRVGKKNRLLATIYLAALCATFAVLGNNAYWGFRYVFAGGMLCNLMVFAANEYRMPVKTTDRYCVEAVQKSDFHFVNDGSAKFGFFGDNFASPAVMEGVFGIGDALGIAGMLITALQFHAGAFVTALKHYL